MKPMILAPTGLLRRRTKLYAAIHRDLRASVQTEKREHPTDKRDRKAQQHFDFRMTGEVRA